MKNYVLKQPVKVGTINISGWCDGEITKIGRKYVHVTFGNQTVAFNPERQQSTDAWSTHTFLTIPQYDMRNRTRIARDVIKAHGLRVIEGTEFAVDDLEKIAAALKSV